MSRAPRSVDRSTRPVQPITEAERAGFAVPDGFVITSDIEPGRHATEILDAARRLDGALAVRSSPVGEGTAGASYGLGRATCPSSFRPDR